MDRVYRYDALDVAKVSIKPSDVQKGSKVVYIPIKYANGDRLVFQTPNRVFCPFGASCFGKNEAMATGMLPNYDFALSLDNNDEKVSKMADFFTKLDAEICKLMAKNEKVLDLLYPPRTSKKGTVTKKINQTKSLEEIQDDLETNKYCPIIKISETKLRPDGSHFPPLLKTKILRDHKSDVQKINTICEVENDNGKMEIVALTDKNIESILPKCIVCRCVLWVSHVWVVNKQFGVSIKLLRVKIHSKKQAKFDFLPASDDEDNENDNDNDNEEEYNNEYSEQENEDPEQDPEEDTEQDPEH